jgi:uncharacterized protein (TIGR02284 family)
MTRETAIETLNLLIRTSRDGEAGFRACAEQLQSPELRELMLSRAEDCARAVEELKPLVSRFGGTPMEGTSAPGDAHRAWVVAKASLTGSDDHAVLNECERGEDIALADYRKALEQDLPDEARQVVEHQLRGVQHNHDQVKALRDAIARGESPDQAAATARRTRDNGRRGRQVVSGRGAPEGGFMHWTLTQARLHPLQTLGVAALVGIIGWSALARRPATRLALGGMAMRRMGRHMPRFSR